MSHVKPWQDEQYIEIGAPPELIYRYLADFTSQLDWSIAVTRIDPPAGGAYFVGAEFTTWGQAPHETRAVRITALQAPMRIAWEAVSQEAREEWEFLIVPSAEASTLVQLLTLHPRNPVLWLLRDQRRARRLSVETRACLGRIKAIIEANVEQG